MIGSPPSRRCGNCAYSSKTLELCYCQLHNAHQKSHYYCSSHLRIECESKMIHWYTDKVRIINQPMIGNKDDIY
jgi:hypothetical protein